MMQHPEIIASSETQKPVLDSTCSVGRSMKMCLSSLPGLIRALSKISALLVAARTMTWSVVPIPVRTRISFAVCPQSDDLKKTICSEIQDELTIHLYQQLVECLLLLSIGETGHVGGAFLPHSVDLVYVDDAGCSRTSLFEQAPHPGSTQAYTHGESYRCILSSIMSQY